MVKYYDQPRTIEHFWTSPKWLGKRMLFLSGPRQVGKTTLVIAKLCPDSQGYYNWDHRKVRMRFREDPDFFSEAKGPWICFDEIHKRPKWKDILKGIYDVHKNQFRFVITGSARLEMFKKSGDSLVGRYFHTHLFPLNLPDFGNQNFSLPKDPIQLINNAGDLADAPVLDDLLQYGGFPEPFFQSSEEFWQRWAQNHRDLIIQEDLRDLTRVIEIDKIEHLIEMLGPSIGNLTSYRKLALHLETTHGSIRRWLQSLIKVQLIFSIAPFSKRISRAYKKEKKWYYTDWRAAPTNRFENYIAASLQRAVTLYTDRFGVKMSLYFVRTHDGTEVDFLICRDEKPWLLIEAKAGEATPSHAIYRFSQELNVPAVVVTKRKNLFKTIKDIDDQKIYCVSWSKLGQLFP